MDMSITLIPAWIILTEQMIAIRFSFDYGHKCTMAFRVFDACQAFPFGSDEGAWQLTDCGETYALDKWQDAFCTIDGDLKWDGCINWQTNPECMMHGCGSNHVEQITAIFQTIYHVGKRHMDFLGDAVPAMPKGALELMDQPK